MKKTFVFFLLFWILIIPTFTFAKQWCCSWHWWVNYCASNWRYVCNDWTYSPSCTCWNVYYKQYLTPDQKCNNKYPGTIYRSSDNRCACPGDRIWTSSRSSIYGCSLKSYNTNSTPSKSYNKNNTSSKSNKDIQCDKKYPWTIYRSADNRCACPGDKVWTSSRNKVTKSCKQTSVYFN